MSAMLESEERFLYHEGTGEGEARSWLAKKTPDDAPDDEDFEDELDDEEDDEIDDDLDDEFDVEEDEKAHPSHPRKYED